MNNLEDGDRATLLLFKDYLIFRNTFCNARNKKIIYHSREKQSFY